MSAPLKEIIQIDDSISPDMNSWTTPLDGYLLLIKAVGDVSIDPSTGSPITAVTASEFYLLIDDDDRRLLIQ